MILILVVILCFIHSKSVSSQVGSKTFFFLSLNLSTFGQKDFWTHWHSFRLGILGFRTAWQNILVDFYGGFPPPPWSITYIQQSELILSAHLNEFLHKLKPPPKIQDIGSFAPFPGQNPTKCNLSSDFHPHWLVSSAYKFHLNRVIHTVCIFVCVWLLLLKISVDIHVAVSISSLIF